MAKYRHTKGQIADNALHALLHDPLFKQRVEKNVKGKGSYRRKEKHGKSGGWEAGHKRHCDGVYVRSSFAFCY